MMLLVSGATRSARRWAEEAPVHVGQFVCPRSRNKVWSPVWATDNAAFSNFDAQRFARMLDHYRGIAGCKFVTVPDVVCDAKATLELWWHWWGQVKRAGYPTAFVLQNGAARIGVPWDLCDAVFIGGDDDFKEGPEARTLVEHAHMCGRWVHMGRVSTKGRLKYAQQIGCDSVDGSGFSRWADHMWPRFARTVIERPQLAFIGKGTP